MGRHKRGEFGDSVELLVPVEQVLLHHIRVGVALLGGEVAVGDGQFRQLEGDTSVVSGVEGGQIGGEDRLGPPVADDVVHHPEQDVPLGGEAYEPTAQAHLVFEGERYGGLVVQQLAYCLGLL